MRKLWNRFRDLATQEERRGYWSAAWGITAVILFGLAYAAWAWSDHAHVSGWRSVMAFLCTFGAVFALYLVFAPLLHTWPHHRRSVASVSAPPRRTPGAVRGHVKIDLGVRLPDGRTEARHQGIVRPRQSTGSLPVVLDMEGFEGDRHSGDGEPDTWVWTASDVVLNNEGDTHLVCRVWLVVEFNGFVRELHRSPDDVVALEPKGHARFDLEFRLPLGLASDEAALDPGKGNPKELVFLEVGTKGRELRVPFDG